MKATSNSRWQVDDENERKENIVFMFSESKEQ